MLKNSAGVNELREGFNTELPVRTCHLCGSEGKPVRGQFNETHGYAFNCQHCGRWIAWGGKDKPIKVNGKRKRSTQWPPSRLKISFCQMCLRSKKFIGKGEKLESHHIIPIEADGKDEPENIWVVCTACHRAIHWNRTYLNDHIQKYTDSYAAMKRVQARFPELVDRVHGREGGCNE